MPEPISTKSIKEITEQIYYRFHEDNATCAVCDQIVRVSQAQLLTAKQLPKKFFEVLQTPTTVPVLHPTLVEQYNISQFFPEEPQLFFYHLAVYYITIHPAKNQKVASANLNYTFVKEQIVFKI